LIFFGDDGVGDNAHARQTLLLAFFLAALDVDINVAERAGSALIAVQNLEFEGRGPKRCLRNSP
jgi:hypothetical protein